GQRAGGGEAGAGRGDLGDDVLPEGGDLPSLLDEAVDARARGLDEHLSGAERGEGADQLAHVLLRETRAAEDERIGGDSGEESRADEGGERRDVRAVEVELHASFPCSVPANSARARYRSCTAWPSCARGSVAPTDSGCHASRTVVTALSASTAAAWMHAPRAVASGTSRMWTGTPRMSAKTCRYAGDRDPPPVTKTVPEASAPAASIARCPRTRPSRTPSNVASATSSREVSVRIPPRTPLACGSAGLRSPSRKAASTGRPGRRWASSASRASSPWST